MKGAIARPIKHECCGATSAWAASLVLLLAWAGHALAAPPRYTLGVDRALTALTVDACFDGGVPARLELDPALPAGSIAGLAPDGSAGRFRPLRARGACTSYALDLRGLGSTNPHAPYQRHGDAVLLDPAGVLALPRGALPPALDVTFVLPEGMHVSAPVPIVAAGAGQVRATLPTRAWSRGGRFAIGRMMQTRLDVGGAQLDVSLVSGSAQPLSAQPAVYFDWITRIGATMRKVFGAFPVPHAQILIVLLPPSAEVVPWGEVVRAGGDGVLLFVDGTRGMSALARDWVAWHEFSHLLHPFLVSADRWLAEGLASYYQNVLRAQAGVLTPREAWQQLAAGFARGAAQADGRETLAEASRDMMEDHAFMHVYWGGAALALRADVALRLRSGNATSLAAVLGDYAGCCLPATDPRQRARAFVRQLDARAGLAVFEPLRARYLHARRFPALAPAWAALGLDADGEVAAGAPDAAARALRRAIMGED